MDDFDFDDDALGALDVDALVAAHNKQQGHDAPPAPTSAATWDPAAHDGLNQQQHAAVHAAFDRPLLILAGAGSGEWAHAANGPDLHNHPHSCWRWN